jgi:hypothetical protein
MEAYSRDKSVYGNGTWIFSGGTWDGQPVPRDVHLKVGKIYRHLNGFKNPHWKEQVLNLQNATTDANGYYLSLDYLVGYSWVIWKDNQGILRKFDISGSYPAWLVMDHLIINGQDLWLPDISSTSNALNRAVINFRKRLRAAQVAFSAPTFLGELGETVHMMRHPLQGLSNLARSYLDRVKDAKKKRPKDWQKNLSGLWLEQAFGWSPLIGDIGRAFKAYNTLTPDKVRFVSGFGKDEKIRSSSTERTSDGRGFLYFYVNKRQVESAIVKLRGCVKRTVSAPYKEQLEHYGFTPTEFFPTAWELLPWSFLIDYFTNVGDIITANITSTSDVAWVDKSVVIHKQYAVGFSPANDYMKGLVGYKGSGGDGTVAKLDSRKWTRSPNVGLPFGTLEFSLPGIFAPWANMSALWAQANASIHPQRRPRGLLL